MRRGDIIRVDLPDAASSSGHEQVGTRPALVVHDDATSQTLPVLMIIPFTSKLGVQHYPHSLLIQPSSTNGLSVPSVLMVFQLRAIDKRRVLAVLGHLEDEALERVNAELIGMLGLRL